jgi:hypothetical protein
MILSQRSSWPDEDRFWSYIVYGPCVVLFIMLLGWGVAWWFRLRWHFFTGAVMPLLLVVATFATGTLLSGLQVDPVHGIDAWVGWMIAAIMFYPFATVWYLSPKRKVRLHAAGTAVVIFAAMLGYSWLARERWRADYYAEHVGQSEVSLLSVGGYHIKWMDRHMGSSYGRRIAPSITYGLVSDTGDLSFYIEATLGPKSETNWQQKHAELMKGLECVDKDSFVTTDRLFCARGRPSILILQGTGFAIYSNGTASAEALPGIAESASIHRWARSDLRYIPIGYRDHSLEPHY